MKTRRPIVSALWLNCLIVNATAEPTIIRPGPCAAQGVYLLAANSGALIRVESGALGTPEDHLIIFRQQQLKGWASQRLLRRFDLQLEEGGPSIINSGAFCYEGN